MLMLILIQYLSENWFKCGFRKMIAFERWLFLTVVTQRNFTDNVYLLFICKYM